MADGQLGVPVEEVPEATSYVVIAVYSVLDSDVAAFASRELWREVGVLDVPKNTRGSTVLQSAGELVQKTMAEGDGSVRFRVWPLGQMLEGQAALEEQAPQLVVTQL